MNPPQKVCKDCGNSYPATESYFPKVSRNQSKLKPRCYNCQRKKHAQDMQEWRSRHPGASATYQRDYRKYHLEHIRGLDRIRGKRDSQKRKEWQRQYRKRHPEKVRKARKSKDTEHGRKLINVAIARRRARKLALPRRWSIDDWEKCLEYWGHTCAVCGRPQGLWHTLAMDHWIPLSDPACPGTVKENIVPLCHGEGGCNNSKGNRAPREWLIERYGARKARKILEKILEYFHSITCIPQ